MKVNMLELRPVKKPLELNNPPKADKKNMLEKKVKKLRRHRRVRAKINGTAETPRLCVFRSNQYIYAQIVDDEKGKTIANAKGDLKSAKEVGIEIAEKAMAQKIVKIVFDRAGYKYHGRVKSLAEGAREKGLKF